MNDSATLFFIHAQTALHPGTGTALGTVDLPIQRERHTGWPTIAASSLKGVLRDATRPADAESATYQSWLAVFGPEPKDAELHAGAVSLTDARTLAFPVRSLKGTFAWVTCRGVLQRLSRDTGLAIGLHDSLPKTLPRAVRENEAIVLAENGEALALDGRLVLEEFDYTTKQALPHEWEWAQWLAERVCPDPNRDRFTGQALLSRLVLLHDDDFAHYVNHATEVVARIGLNYATKTVKKGALFYQEFLPAETLLYAIVIASDSRRKDCRLSASQVLEFVQQGSPELLQIGGDETIGKGLCSVRFDGKAGGQ